jgi:proteasome lid subunit RPN8/RPN11
MIDLSPLVPFVLIHAEGEAPRECCGVIVREANGHLIYCACRNIAHEKDQFVIHPDDYVRWAGAGEIVAIAHSHVLNPAAPTEADRAEIERYGLPWLIVNVPTGAYVVALPDGYRAPLIGRPFVHGLHDCYGIVRDYYASVGVPLHDYPRSYGWWDEPDGPDLYRENFEAEGFVQIASGFEDARLKLRQHDLILMNIRARRDNHMAVYLGGGVILHHLIDQLSRRETYQEFYQRRTTAVLRHRAFMTGGSHDDRDFIR